MMYMIVCSLEVEKTTIHKGVKRGGGDEVLEGRKRVEIGKGWPEAGHRGGTKCAPLGQRNDSSIQIVAIESQYRLRNSNGSVICKVIIFNFLEDGCNRGKIGKGRDVAKHQWQRQGRSQASN